MSSKCDHIPLYAPDGRCVGWRTLANAQRLVAAGFLEPSYGRKGHLRAVWLRESDGRSPVTARARAGTKYSHIEHLENGGRCWRLRRVEQRDEDGQLVSTRGVFIRVLLDCLAT